MSLGRRDNTVAAALRGVLRGAGARRAVVPRHARTRARAAHVAAARAHRPAGHARAQRVAGSAPLHDTHSTHSASWTVKAVLQLWNAT